MKNVSEVHHTFHAEKTRKSGFSLLFSTLHGSGRRDYMIYKKYGKTGKDISVIGFGGMRFPKTGDTYDYETTAN
ncbi:MAG: aldo/keto reductase [Eubacterium sp.]|nr:aldo/keto reductase [Eubacterium sp.]